MRTLKFRAWDPNEKKMWNENNIVVGGGVFLYGGHNTETLVHSYTLRNDLTPMQFTGLLDKNGKDVFEGDKVSMTIKVNGETDKVSAGEVFWNKKKAAWSPNRMTFADTEVEIIGNIYENPELLTQHNSEV